MPSTWRWQLGNEEERRTLVGTLRSSYGLELEDEQEPVLATSEVALLLRVSPATVRRWANAGKLEARRTLGGRRMFPLSAVRRILATDRHAAPVVDAAPVSPS